LDRIKREEDARRREESRLAEEAEAREQRRKDELLRKVDLEKKQKKAVAMGLVIADADLLKMSVEDLDRRAMDKVHKEKEGEAKKRSDNARKLDHYVRALREVERPRVDAMAQAAVAAEEAYVKATAEAMLQRARARFEANMELRSKVSRMLQARSGFEAAIFARRKEEYAATKEALLDKEKAAFLQAKLRRAAARKAEADRRRAEEVEREAERKREEAYQRQQREADDLRAKQVGFRSTFGGARGAPEDMEGGMDMAPSRADENSNWRFAGPSAAAPTAAPAAPAAAAAPVVPGLKKGTWRDREASKKPTPMPAQTQGRSGDDFRRF
jgi:translation initiation factor 3 subunit A